MPSEGKKSQQKQEEDEDSGRQRDSNRLLKRGHLQGSSHPKEGVGMLAPGRAPGGAPPFPTPTHYTRPSVGFRHPVCKLGGLDKVRSRSCRFQH